MRRARATGTRLAYTHYDHPAPSRHIVLIHSLAMDWSFWRPVAERLATNASVLIPDCRGHGGSDNSPGLVTVELHADDLADLLDRIGWRTALVAGASMGGCIALAFAIRHPGVCRRSGLSTPRPGTAPTHPRTGSSARMRRSHRACLR